MTKDEMRRLLREVLPFIGYEGEGSQEAAEKVRLALREMVLETLAEINFKEGE